MTLSSMLEALLNDVKLRRRFVWHLTIVILDHDIAHKKKRMNAYYVHYTRKDAMCATSKEVTSVVNV